MPASVHPSFRSSIPPFVHSPIRPLALLLTLVLAAVLPARASVLGIWNFNAYGGYQIPWARREAAAARWFHLAISADGTANTFHMWVNGETMNYPGANPAGPLPWPTGGGMQLMFTAGQPNDGAVIGRWLGGAGAMNRTMGLASLVVLKNETINQERARYLYQIGRRGIAFDGNWFSVSTNVSNTVTFRNGLDGYMGTRDCWITAYDMTTGLVTLVQGWVSNPASNQGMLLYPSGPADFDIYSTLTGGSVDRPSLMVTYTVGDGLRPSCRVEVRGVRREA